MSKTITIQLDQELGIMLDKMMKAKRTKNKSQIIREALWDYSQKILDNFNTIELKGVANGDC